MATVDILLKRDLLHPFIVVPLTMLWVSILRAHGIEVLFEHGSTSSSNLGNDGWVWAGCNCISSLLSLHN